MADAVTNAAEQPRQDSLATAIATVMVHVDFDRGSDDRIRIAADLARRFGAVLIGIAGWVPGRDVGGWFGAEFERTEDRFERISAELAELAEHFRNVAGRPVPAVEWRGTFHFPREVIATEARAADLVVIGSHSTADDAFHAFEPGAVLLNAGRPVLVVPDGITSLAGQRVMIAWKDTREARHAVRGALPLLRAANHVALVEVAEDVLERAAREQLDDVERYLGRHDIKVGAKTVLQPQKGSIADQLKSAAKKEEADLIVAGAYGHTRLGEWIFGGVTHGLLRNGEVCCLFSN